MHRQMPPRFISNWKIMLSCPIIEASAGLTNVHFFAGQENFVNHTRRALGAAFFVPFFTRFLFLFVCLDINAHIFPRLQGAEKTVFTLYRLATFLMLCDTLWIYARPVTLPYVFRLLAQIFVVSDKKLFAAQGAALWNGSTSFWRRLNFIHGTQLWSQNCKQGSECT